MKDKAWYVEQHRAMWNWIADEIERWKRTFCISTLKYRWCEKRRLKPLAWCFACEYDLQFDDATCKHCLFNQTEMGGLETCCEGYYARCVSSTTWQEQAELARTIANLPVRKDV